MNKESLPNKFWREYLESDELSKDEKLNKLSIVNKILNFGQFSALKKEYEEIARATIKLELKSLFDDLINYMELRKDGMEKNKKTETEGKD